MRHNLSLKIEQAQIALLRKDAEVWRLALAEAQRWTEDYFDGEDEAVQGVLRELARLEGERVSVRARRILSAPAQRTHAPARTFVLPRSYPGRPAGDPPRRRPLRLRGPRRCRRHADRAGPGLRPARLVRILLETSIWFAGVLLLVALLVLRVLLAVFDLIFGSRRGVRDWNQARKRRRAQRSTQAGLLALARGDFCSGAKALERFTDDAEAPVVNLLEGCARGPRRG